MFLNHDDHARIMKVSVTDAVSRLTGIVTKNAVNARDKAMSVWKHVRDIPYDVFGVTTRNPDEMIAKNALTCYGKSIVQASMLEAAGIPWRFEFSMCPSHAIEHTIRSLSDSNPLLLKAFESLPGMFKGKELFHSTIQANIDDKWTRMDSTIPESVCNKIQDPEKRDNCLTLDNVSAVHECHVIGHGKDIPDAPIRSWNALSVIGGIVNSAFKK
jgi:hypothetical protein